MPHNLIEHRLAKGREVQVRFTEAAPPEAPATISESAPAAGTASGSSEGPVADMASQPGHQLGAVDLTGSQCQHELLLLVDLRLDLGTV